MLVPSVDVYVTYRCNLRCSHCFVGDNLATNHNFPFDSLMRLIDASPTWGTEEITFLGGEPTLYPHIGEAVGAVQAAGMTARMVTNGLHGFRAFMDHHDGPQLPLVGFSIDGSTPATHDAIRGPRTFNRMIANIEHARSLGYQAFAIVSVSRTNADDLLRVLDLCDSLSFTHVNIHYVTNRGFATEEMMLSVQQWQALCRDVQRHSAHLALDVRIEQTFAAPGGHRSTCAVRDRTNMMFLPDGRVFMCPLFIDVPNAHSFVWTGSELIRRGQEVTEESLSTEVLTTHCPAIPHVSPALQASAGGLGLEITCALEKTRLRGGQIIDDKHGGP